MRGYFLASVALLIIGGIPFLLGLPYAITHFGCARWCGGNPVNMGSDPPLGWVLGYDGTFQPCMPYSLILLAVGGLLFLAYKVERNEIPNKQ